MKKAVSAREMAFVGGGMGSAKVHCHGLCAAPDGKSSSRRMWNIHHGKLYEYCDTAASSRRSLVVWN
ncbi:unnamed protein product, partial [Brenthis ino]